MSIKYRLFFALLGASTVVVVSMFLLLQWSVDRGFLRYVNTVEQERLENLAGELERAYAEEGSWAFLGPEPGRWLRRMAAGGEWPGAMPHPRAERGGGVPPRDHDRPLPMRAGRLLLLDAGREPLFGSRAERGEVELRPLRVGGEVVGYLGVRQREKLTDFHELRFVERQKLAMALVAGIMLLVSAGLSFPLANRLVRPVRALAFATHRLAAGGYATRVPVGAADELGGLARDFNDLARTLEKNEQARRQWLADVSHELRTPLAVLRGEIEAIEDGVREATPEAIRSLHAEVMHLGHLVDDLHQLALSDLGALTYRKEEVALPALLAGVVERFRPEMARKGLALAADLPSQAVMVFADPERLRQLFANLLENAVKYTDAGGQVEVRLEKEGEEAVVHLVDSAPGVPESELERLFERFYRVEGSRRRATGGAGLGLAICRNIVEAHGGTITARPSPIGGLWLEVRLPVRG